MINNDEEAPDPTWREEVCIAGLVSILICLAVSLLWVLLKELIWL